MSARFPSPRPCEICKKKTSFRSVWKPDDTKQVEYFYCKDCRRNSDVLIIEDGDISDNTKR